MGKTLDISYINVKRTKVTNLKSFRIGLYGIAGDKSQSLSHIDKSYALYLVVAIGSFIAFLIITFIFSYLCCKSEVPEIENNLNYQANN